MRRVIISGSKEPSYNLAAEEYLVSVCRPEDEILFLWQNERTVVIGRNQNPWKECDVEAFHAIGGKLVRRLSGGGAVYHDLGNLNFTFVSAASDGLIERNSALILNTLRLYDVNARFTGKNDILVGEKKVSGCAYYEENGILCHHGTLLVNTDIDALEAALKPSVLKLQSKGIDSIRSRVMNLFEIDARITVQELTAALCRQYTGSDQFEDLQTSYPETLPEIASRKAVYESWDWCFGETPEFGIQQAYRFPWGEVDIHLDMTDGVIRNVKIFSDALDIGVAVRLESLLQGERFNDLDDRIGEIVIDNGCL